jgi:hypothetical protein
MHKVLTMYLLPRSSMRGRNVWTPSTTPPIFEGEQHVIGVVRVLDRVTSGDE